MSTEEDTFNRLRKSSFEEVRPRVGMARIAVFMGKEPEESVSDILRRHGWTLEEYDAKLLELTQVSEDFSIKNLLNGDFEVCKTAELHDKQETSGQ